MTRYSMLSSLQLLVLALLIAILAGVFSSINTWYIIYNNLPIVQTNSAGECVKVLNFENGHAFNCNDVDVVLRRYRKSVE